MRRDCRKKVTLRNAQEEEAANGLEDCTVLDNS